MTAWRSGYQSVVGEERTAKYHNEKVIVNGISFDSRKEARRYKELALLEQAGSIAGLRRQVKFVLIPAQREKDPSGKLRVVEHECSYVADFVYVDTKTGKTIVEDVKSPATRTKAYIIKRKLMRYIHHIAICEV